MRGRKTEGAIADEADEADEAREALEVAAGWALACSGRTARAARRLLLERGSIPAVVSLSIREAVEIGQEPEEAVLPLLEPRSVPGIDEQLRRLSAAGARLIDLLDDEYPCLLRQIPDPPVLLFARGKRLDGVPAVAIVGSRRPSRSGLETARRLAGDLSRAGLTIVSGFARGIDHAAHQAALEAGGRTVAVLGSGVDICYPEEHRALVPTLMASGTFLSEFPMGMRPQPFHFPIRNRVIAGIVPLVLVVEAAERSGSLITARHAADFGRDVAAVPGAVLTPHATGSNALLKDGAILVRSADDVLAELQESQELQGLPRSAARGTPLIPALLERLGADPGAVYRALDPDDPRGPDALAAATGLGPSRLSAALVLLELEGLATPLPGAVFVRRRDGD